MGDEIRSAGQYFPDGADHPGHMFDTVYNGIPIVTEDNIAVFSHNFNEQRLLAQITQFIQMFYINTDDAFQTRLSDSKDLPVLDIFAQQHTEIGGSHGAGHSIRSEIDQGQGSAGGEKEPVLRFTAAYCEKQRICFRLCYFYDASAGEGAV